MSPDGSSSKPRGDPAGSNVLLSAAQVAAFVLLAALLGVGGWVGYRAGWRSHIHATVEQPVAEYREVQSGPGGDTGSLLTIDRAGQATVQTLPLGPGSKTLHAELTCAELYDLPHALHEEFPNFLPRFGREGPPYQGEISITGRWETRERRVVWHNPPSPPRPPEGRWAHVAVYFEDIRRRATEAAAPPISNGPSEDAIVLAFGHNSTGVVGTYVSALSIHQSGYVTFGDGLSYPWTIGHTQLAPEELARLLRTVEEAKFVEFQHCYGRHAPFNPQDSWMMYNWGGKTRGVVWMSDPAEPRPPEGWSRITALLEPIRARIEQQKQEPNAPPHPRPR